jgi:Tol biopolymer transport system component
MELSPDDQLIAASIYANGQGCYLGIWDAIKSKEQLHYELGAYGVNATAVAFSPEGQLLATSDPIGVLSIWEGDKEFCQRTGAPT